MPAKGLAGRTKSEAARQRKDPMQNLKPFTKENAAEFIRDLTGQQPVTSLDRARTKLMNAQAEQIKRQGDPSKEITKLDLLLKAMDAVAGDDSGTN